MGVPAIHGYYFHPWMADIHEWNATDHLVPHYLRIGKHICCGPFCFVAGRWPRAEYFEASVLQMLDEVAVMLGDVLSAVD